MKAIFERTENWGDGALQLLDWLAEAQGIFKESVGTICPWFGEVTGYSFRNFDDFQLPCLICWHLASS